VDIVGDGCGCGIEAPFLTAIFLGFGGGSCDAVDFVAKAGGALLSSPSDESSPNNFSILLN